MQPMGLWNQRDATQVGGMSQHGPDWPLLVALDIRGRGCNKAIDPEMGACDDSLSD
jgi:hypothetical protein